MSKIHELAFNAEEIDELLDSVDKKTIYQDATQSEHGLMSTTDKTKLDALPTAQQIEGSLSEKVDKEAGKGLSKNDYTDADKAKVASALQEETDPTVPSWAKQQNKPSYDYSEIGNTPDLSGFITKSVNDLTNYYLKSETYTKAEVVALIGAIQQFHYEIYQTLPSSGESNVLYLIGPTGSGSDKYEEYVYSNNSFTKIGDTSIDLSGYVTTSALNTALSAYTTTSDLTTLLSNKADKVSNSTNGNFAGLDANGNLTDSGKKASDFATASQGAKADTALQPTGVKTINNQSIVGSGNITIEGGGGTDDYADLDNKPQINSVTLSGNKNASDLGLATAAQGAKADMAYQKPSTGIPASDIASGVIPDISGKEDTSNKVSTITGNETNTNRYPNTKAAYDAIHPAYGSSQPQDGMLPNVLYKLGTLSGSVEIVFAAPSDNTVENEYKFTFTSDSTAPTITWPQSVTNWIGNSIENGAPKVDPDTYYEVSVLDGYGIFNTF